MTATNTWPDTTTYATLMEAMALGAKPEGINLRAPCITAAAVLPSQAKVTATYLDNKTDLYVNTPFTVPHLVAPLEAFGPNISEFLLPIPGFLDIGCPSTVISASLSDKLGL